MVLARGLQQLRGDRRRFGNRFAFHGRDGLGAVRLIISDPLNKEKNGTAQRPSLAEWAIWIVSLFPAELLAIHPVSGAEFLG